MSNKYGKLCTCIRHLTIFRNCGRFSFAGFLGFVVSPDSFTQGFLVISCILLDYRYSVRYMDLPSDRQYSFFCDAQGTHQSCVDHWPAYGILLAFSVIRIDGFSFLSGMASAAYVCRRAFIRHRFHVDYRHVRLRLLADPSSSVLQCILFRTADFFVPAAACFRRKRRFCIGISILRFAECTDRMYRLFLCIAVAGELVILIERVTGTLSNA